MDRVGARPENGHQARLLRLLRDRGQASRAELGEAVGLSEVQGRRRARPAHRARAGRTEGPRGVPWGAALPLVGLAGSPALRRHRHRRHLHRRRRSPTASCACSRTPATQSTSGGARTWSSQEALDLVAKLRADGRAPEVHGVGVGVPGPVSQREGCPVMPPIMPGWNRFPVRDVLSAALGAPVMVDNDVNIMALGELHAGTARSVEDFLFVKIGTGIGCGIVVDGQVYRGADGAPATSGTSASTDAGPTCTCGNTGLPRGVVRRSCARPRRRGGRALRPLRPARRAAGRRRRAHRRATSAAAAAAGDPVAVGLVRDGGRRLGLALAGARQLLQPRPRRHRRRSRRARPPAARRDPQRRLPPVTATGDGEPAHRPVRARRDRRRHRCRPPRLGLRLQHRLNLPPQPMTRTEAA